LERREAVAIILFVVTSCIVACGGARKPCDAPIHSLDGEASASAQPAEIPAPSE